MNNVAANNREHGFDAFDLFFRHGEIIVRERDEVRQLAGSNRPFLPVLTGKPTAALCVEAERLFAGETALVGIHRNPTDRLARDEPVK